jgi:DNA-binding transcriptional LysR family regulator
MQVSNRVVDLVEEGVDVALRVRPTLDDSGSLVVKNLGRTQTCWCAARPSFKRQGVPQSVHALANMDSVAMSAVDGKGTWQLLGPGDASHTLVHQPRYVADDLLTLKLRGRSVWHRHVAHAGLHVP